MKVHSEEPRSVFQAIRPKTQPAPAHQPISVESTSGSLRGELEFMQARLASIHTAAGGVIRDVFANLT